MLERGEGQGCVCARRPVHVKERDREGERGEAEREGEKRLKHGRRGRRDLERALSRRTRTQLCSTWTNTCRLDGNKQLSGTSAR